MKKLLLLVMAVLMVGSVVLMVMVIHGKTSAQNFRDQSKQLIKQAKSATSKAQTQFEKAQAELVNAQQMAQVMEENYLKLDEEFDRIRSIIVDPARPSSQEELDKAHAATAKAIAELKQTRLMVAELREEIERLRPPIVGKPAPIPPRGVYTIQSHDIANDFYVISAGSDNGMKKGDKFTVVRAGKEIGKIEIGRVQPTVSIAVLQRRFPKPPAPFKRGDKVMEIK